MATERANCKSKETLSNLKGDYGNIGFLLLLYILQGIPIGLSSAVPLLLQNRKVSYSDQALFSFVTWPFSLKLLWAPIVDAVYIRWFGRRKTWLVPIQLLIGISMLILSGNTKTLLAEDPSSGAEPNILLLTLIFLCLNFLAATQDIAVDGWALTMLSRRNVGYASTCNSAGQTAGFFIGNVIFLALESTDFSNKYLRSVKNQKSTGIVTFDEFLFYCGIAFILITVLVAILKREKSTSKPTTSSSDIELRKKLVRKKNSDSAESSATTDKRLINEEEMKDDFAEKDLSVMETYSLLYKIMKLPSFRIFAIVFLTCKIGFAAPDAVSGLKLVEAGVHKENLALLAVPMVPLQICLPWIISRMTCGPRPLDLYIKSYPWRLLFGFVFPMIVFWTPSFKLSDESFPFYYYAALIIIYAVHQVTVYSMFVSSMAFHAAVSDPSIGGTYMTLLNTISNLGGNWPSTASLWLVDKLTINMCSELCSSNSNSTNHTISTVKSESKNGFVCTTRCSTMIDGYYIECIACVVIGFIWLRWGSSKLKRLQSLPQIAWSVAGNKVH